MTSLSFSPDILGNSFNCTNSSIFSEENRSTNNTKHSTYFQKDRLKILYTNADCLTKTKKYELVHLIHQHHIDIICITEINPKNATTKIPPEELHKIEGFDSYFADNNGRGLVIFVKSHLKSHELKDDVVPFKESVWIEIQLENQDKLLLGCLYRSPSSNDDSVHRILATMQKMCNLNHSHFLAF